MRRSLALLAVLAVLVGVTPAVAQDVAAMSFEQLTVAGSSTTFTASTVNVGGKAAARCVGVLETAPIRIRVDGTAATATVGELVPVGATVDLRGVDNVRKFSAWRTTTVSGVLPMTCYPSPAENAPYSGIAVIPTPAGSTAVTERVTAEDFTESLAVFEQDFTAKVLTDAATNYVLGSPMGLITYREEQAKTASSWIITAANKLDISADNTTDNEGVEIYLGDGLVTDASAWLTTGLTGGCFEVNFTITLIAGTDQFVIGWRQNEAFVGDNVYTGYADWSVVGINNVDGSIFSLGEVAGGGTLSDDSGTNAANAGTYTLKSCIDATTRVPTAFLNGTAITMTNSGVAKTTATKMNPFISYLEAGGAVDPAILVNWWTVTR